MKRDLYNRLDIVSLLDSVVLTLDDADQESGTFDVQNRRDATYIVNVGSSGDTLTGSLKFTLVLQESDDDITFTDVANADMLNATGTDGTGEFGVIDGAADEDTTYVTGYIGTKRYTQVLIQGVGTHTSGTPFAVNAVGQAYHQPATK